MATYLPHVRFVPKPAGAGAGWRWPRWTRGAPNTGRMLALGAGAALLLLVVATLGLWRTDAATRRLAVALPPPDVLFARVYTARAWPLPPPYEPVAAAEAQIATLAAANEAVLARMPDTACVFPAAYTHPWALVSLRAPPRTLVNVSVAGYGPRVLARVHALDASASATVLIHERARLTFDAVYARHGEGAYDVGGAGVLEVGDAEARCVQGWLAVRPPDH